MSLVATKSHEPVSCVPDHWDTKTLAELTSKIGDGIHATPKYVESSPFRFINGNNLSNGHVVMGETTKSVSEDEYRLHKQDLGDGTILMSINGTIGNLAFYGGENVVLGKSAAYLNVKPEIDKSYVYYQLQSYQVVKQFDDALTGTTIRNLSLEAIRTTPIPLPPPAEQRAIAEALSDVDALINALDALITKKRHIKQGTMQQLLTGNKRLPGFKGKWETKQLKEIAVCLDNLRVPLNESQRAEMQGQFPYCGANGILDYVNDFVLDDDVVLIAEDGGYFDEYATRPIAYRMSGKCWVNNHAHILKARDGFNQDFIFYSLVHKDIQSHLASGTRAKLNKSEMNKIEIQLPPTEDEQEHVAIILNDMDSEITALERKRDKTKLIKQGMMQELLTGRTRLI